LSPLPVLHCAVTRHGVRRVHPLLLRRHLAATSARRLAATSTHARTLQHTRTAPDIRVSRGAISRRVSKHSG
jgi:hypothetical protein